MPLAPLTLAETGSANHSRPVACCVTRGSDLRSKQLYGSGTHRAIVADLHTQAVTDVVRGIARGSELVAAAGNCLVKGLARIGDCSNHHSLAAEDVCRHMHCSSAETTPITAVISGEAHMWLLLHSSLLTSALLHRDASLQHGVLGAGLDVCTFNTCTWRFYYSSMQLLLTA